VFVAAWAEFASQVAHHRLVRFAVVTQPSSRTNIHPLPVHTATFGGKYSGMELLDAEESKQWVGACIALP
jgi:hypothetical protein